VVRFTVTGDSMRPRLLGGDTVLLRKVSPDRLRRGDLLLCRHAGATGDRLLLHRVVAIHRRGRAARFQTQGDALATPDAPVTGDQVLGRVCAVAGTAPGAEPLSLDTPAQRGRALLVALWQRALWRARVTYARLRRAGARDSHRD
jgi:signal peptidase I